MSEQVTGNKQIGAVILAAGYSSRMGTFKPGLQIGDKTVVSRLIASFYDAGIKDIVVVSGYNREVLLPLIAGLDVTESYNESFPKGMFTSIQAGVKKTATEWRGFFLIPVDCPLLEKETIELLVSEIKDDSSFVVPCYRGKKGHPLYIPIKYRDEILSHDGTDGLKGITDKYDDFMKRVETGRESTVLDMDTPAAYQRLKAFYEGGMKSESLASLAAGRTFYLIRHGQPQQHRDKIFLGQTDVPLSEKGKEQAAKAKDILPVGIKRIYSSNLMRAKQTAQIICSEIIEVEGFREMNLGSWDGRYIEDIKREFPELYEKRGKNIFSFKTGNRAENFYDLQYRVIKSLVDVLKKDDDKEIFIVAHSGVIRCIETNLKGGNVDDAWEKTGNGEIRVIKA